MAERPYRLREAWSVVMKHGDVREEPSMDEILSSIRKIIAEDEVEAPKPSPGRAPSAARPIAADDEPLTLTDDDEGSDIDDDVEVLELSADDEGDEPPLEDFVRPALDDLVDEITEELVDDLDDELETELVEEADAGEPGTPPTMAEPSPPVAEVPPAPAVGIATPVAMDAQRVAAEMLLDGTSAGLAGGALQRLAQAMSPSGAVGGSNRSIETFLADLLRPELKGWLDTNLPALVERIVEREIKKLVRDAQPE